MHYGNQKCGLLFSVIQWSTERNRSPFALVSARQFLPETGFLGGCRRRCGRRRRRRRPLKRRFGIIRLIFQHVEQIRLNAGFVRVQLDCDVLLVPLLTRCGILAVDESLQQDNELSMKTIEQHHKSTATWGREIERGNQSNLL